MRLVLKVLVVEPSPKSQKRLMMAPVEVSVKETVSGLRPLVGAPTKPATGTIPPVPMTELVLLPPLPVAKTTVLLELEALVGAKRTTTLVVPKPGRLKGVPERMTNTGPPAVKEAEPFVSAAPPGLVRPK